jgi:hypothetical protein
VIYICKNNRGGKEVKLDILSFIAKLMGITFRINGIAYGAPVDRKMYDRR